MTKVRHGEKGRKIPYKFTAMPNEWIDDRTLKAGEKVVLLALIRRAGMNGKCFASHEDLGRLAGMGTSTLRRHLIQLRNRGIVDWVQNQSGEKGRGSNSYRIKTPQESTSESSHATRGSVHSEHNSGKGSARIDQGVVLDSSEEIDSMEIEEEGESAALRGEVVDLYHQLYRERYGESPAIGSYETKIATNLVAKVNLERTLSTLRRAFALVESLWFCKNTRLTLGVFARHFDAIPIANVGTLEGSGSYVSHQLARLRGVGK